MESLQVLIKGCVDNNPSYQKTLYRRFYGYALKIVFRYIYSYDTAADVVNDGFVKVFNNFHRFHTGLPESELEKLFMGWMKKIMVNTALLKFRNKTHLKAVVEFNPEIHDVEEHLSVIAFLEERDLVNLVQKLSPVYRMVFTLYVLEGMKHREIAVLLGISEGTSKSNLADARAKLQKALPHQDLRVVTDLRNEKITYKIREHALQKLPYILVAGDKEKAAGAVAVRARGNKDLGVMSLDAFVELIARDIASKA